jgi:hypothetical protein
VRLLTASIGGAVLAATHACGGDPCSDTQHETPDGACVADDGNDTDSDEDTDTTVDPSEAGTLTADVTPSAGASYTFVATSVSGGFAENVLWAFTAIGYAPSDFLAFEVAGSPGLGTYVIGTAANPNFVLYSDVTNLSTGTVFGSLDGSLTVSRWDETEWDLGEAYLTDGTFEVTLSDGMEPTPLTLEVTGEFADVWMVGDSYESR